MALLVSTVLGISLIPGIGAPLVMSATISAKVCGYGASFVGRIVWVWGSAGMVCTGGVGATEAVGGGVLDVK